MPFMRGGKPTFLFIVYRVISEGGYYTNILYACIPSIQKKIMISCGVKWYNSNIWLRLAVYVKTDNRNLLGWHKCMGNKWYLNDFRWFTDLDSFFFEISELFSINHLKNNTIMNRYTMVLYISLCVCDKLVGSLQRKL